MDKIEYIPGEEWKDIPNFKGMYQISNLGRVKSLQRFEIDNRHKGQLRIRYGRILKQATDKGGYKIVVLSKDAKPHRWLVHRLVAIAFIPNPNNYPIINHKDMIRDNNKVSNLEWCTTAYNNSYGDAQERRTKSLKGKPFECFWKKVAQYTIDGKLVKVWDSIVQAKRETGIGHISEVCCGSPHCHTAGGYIWKHVSENSEMEV